MRRGVLQAAKSVFLESGFGGTTMDAVAARARVSKMTVYRHFEDKEALFAGVISELCEQFIHGDIESVPDLPPDEALRGFARQTISILYAPDTIKLHRIVIAEGHRFPQLGRLFNERGPEASIAALERYFVRIRGDHRVRITTPRHSAEEFLELLRGYTHLRLLLGIESYPAQREINRRIQAAVRHVLT